MPRTDFEVWVVGDACTDDTAEAVAELNDDRLHYLAREVNCGSQAFPNNDGLARASAAHIAYLNHDDLWFPWHLEGLLHRLEETGADHAHDYYARLGTEGVVSVQGPPRPGRSFADWFVCPSSWLVRRELLEQVGPWPNPDRTPVAVDVSMLRRFHRAGARFTCVSRLGLLKFPSRLTHSFADPEARPQTHWAARLLDDPERLEHEVLWELARIQVATEPPPPTLWAALRYHRDQLARTVLNWYGRERWPVSAWEVRRMQAYRRRLRVARGLTRAS
ncbi:MAG: glycosyltransferase [Armatimonadetes bacterium]|nr:glycosyltransferase [Armatimonadota bacterium]